MGRTDRMRARWGLCLVLFAIGCGDDGGTATADADVRDGSGDASVPADTGSEPVGRPCADAADDCGAGFHCDVEMRRCVTGCLDDSHCSEPSTCELPAGRCVCAVGAGFCVDDLSPGHWHEVAGSRLVDVGPDPIPPGNLEDVVAAWSGGSFDTERDRLIVWGGGHADYSGNEIYVFDLATLAWTRVTDPSLDVGGDAESGYYPDGLPRSRHTYDYLQYIPPPVDRFCSLGGAALYPSGNVSTENVDCFDFETSSWELLSTTPISGTGTVSAHDPVTGHVFVGGRRSGDYLARWEPPAGPWTRVGDLDGGLGIDLTGEIDPVARLFVAVGAGRVATWDIESSDAPRVAPELADPPTSLDTNNPGLAFDSTLGRIVYWGGGPDVYSIDFGAMRWRRHPPAPTNSVVPTAPAGWGTYGRFQYSPRSNVFVLVNSAEENVFLYRIGPEAP